MTAPVRTVSASESVMAADELLRGYRISSLVVIDGGQPVGVLARSDLLDELIDDPASPLPVRGGDTDIASRMTRNAIHIDAAAPLIAGCRLLLEAEVHQLVVVENQIPVGILSRRDAVAAVRDLALEEPLIGAATPIAFTINADQSVREAQRFLEHAELTTVIVTDGQFPVGVFGPREQLLARELPRARLPARPCGAPAPVSHRALPPVSRTASTTGASPPAAPTRSLPAFASRRPGVTSSPSSRTSRFG
jgi:CBS domain-containing protein